jgi:hypothetical protein
VSFIQMLKVCDYPVPSASFVLISREKAFTPVAILLISALFKLQHLTQQLALIVAVRSFFLRASRCRGVRKADRRLR